MKKNIFKFIKRGLMFSSGGPLVYAIVMLILDICGVDTLSDGTTIFKAILSTSIMAFLVSGVSVVWQEERLGMGLSILIHGTTLYISYLGLYLLNDWIPKSTISILIFSLLFIGTYLVIWMIIYIVEKRRVIKFNKQFNK